MCVYIYIYICIVIYYVYAVRGARSAPLASTSKPTAPPPAREPLEDFVFTRVQECIRICIELYMHLSFSLSLYIYIYIYVYIYIYTHLHIMYIHE